jgi:hypothetical protein
MSLDPELDSEGLAGLVVDALIRAHFLPAGVSERALKIAAEEISVRKCFGDYWCKVCPLRHRHEFPGYAGDGAED